MKKLNNKGFSLVELIIVIAIMAVLIAVLAPQFLRYVERSRIQTDNTALSEIMRAMEIAASDEDVAAEVVAGGATGIPHTAAGAAGANKVFTFGTATDLETEVSNTVGGTVTLTSNTYTNAAAGPTVRAIWNTATGTVNIEVQNFFSEANGTLITAWTRADAIGN